MKKYMLSLLVATGALLASPVGFAASISAGPVSIGPAQTDWTTTAGLGLQGAFVLGGGAAQVDQFDPSLGTLTAVTITVDVAFSGTQTIVNNGQSSIFIQNADTIVSWFFDVLDNTGGLGDETVSSGPIGVHANEMLAPGNVIDDTLSVSVPGTILNGLDFGSLSDFTGNGSWAFGCASTVTINYVGGAAGASEANGGADCVVGVTYDYIPDGLVSLPASLFLMLPGLLGLALVRYR